MKQSHEVFFCADANRWWPAYEPTARSWKAIRSRLRDHVEAVRHVGDFTACVQAGGHVGCWPEALAGYFGAVHTFEPDAACYEALRRNTERTPKITAYQYALGDRIGSCAFSVHRNSGSAKVSPDGKYTVPVTTIDALALPKCGLLCLDVEGSEVAALAGAAQTIRRCRPVIYVEELDAYRDSLRAYLREIGYRMIGAAHKDTAWIPA